MLYTQRDPQFGGSENYSNLFHYIYISDSGDDTKGEHDYNCA